MRIVILVAGVAILVFLVIAWICKWLAWEGQDSIQLIFILLTLWALVFYAHDTHRIAELQAEEVGLAKRPRISIHNRNATAAWFLTSIVNHSNVHAYLYVTAKVIWDDVEIDLSENTEYNGKNRWRLQPNQRIDGHLDLKKYLNNMDIGSRSPTHNATVTLSYRVSIYDEREENLEFKKFPTTEYTWKTDVWVPEVILKETEVLENS